MTNDTPGLSEADRKAALDAFRKDQRIPEHHEIIESSPKVVLWLRAWELATQAAYERAAQRIEQFTNIWHDPFLSSGVGADAIRALTKWNAEAVEKHRQTMNMTDVIAKGNKP